MVCYIIPTVAAIVHYILRKNMPTWKNKYHLWLNIMLLGGAVFGVVDHLWNRELFLIGEKPILDLMLGLTITTVIVVTWTAVVVLDKVKVKETVKITN